jgi:phage-related tail protein
MAEANTESNVSGEGQETVDALKARLGEMETTLKSLSDEATKHKNIRRTVEKERDELRAKTKSTDQSTEDYKALWQQTTEKLTKVQERTKTADIRSALTEQLQKSKVASDKFDAALDLVDRSLIEWDEEAGVDRHSVTAAVQKAKSKYGFLFEMTVAATDPKQAGEGGIKNSITRAAFDALTPTEKVAKVKAKVQITD